MAEEQQALGLSWVFGISRDVPDNAVFLNNGETITVAYAAAHTVVILDVLGSQQGFLQGHRHAITCLTATNDRKLLLSADAGPEPLLVFWDVASRQPLATVTHPHQHGIVAMALSPDNTQLVTLGAVQREEEAQQVAVWDLSELISRSGSSGGAQLQLQPAISTLVPPGDPQLTVKFNVNDPSEFITNGKRRVYFWSLPARLQGGSLSYYSPPLKASDFGQSVGDFITSTFVPGSTQALTSTEDGDVVMWDQQGAYPVIGTRASDRQAVKIMRLHESAIHVLSCVGTYVVTGAADGMVRFFDSMMRLIGWFEHLAAGPVRCVAFAQMESMGADGERQKHLNELTVPDFLVSTGLGKLVAVASASFDDPLLQPGHDVLVDTPITTRVPIAANPARPELLLLDGSKSSLQCWDLLNRCKVAEEKLPMGVGRGTAVSISRDGSIGVVGCDSGHLVALKASSLEEVVVLKNTGQRITRVSISSNGRFIAAATAAHTVLLYGFLPYRGSYLQWDFVGKFKAHYDAIVGLQFGEAPSGETRLFSLGREGRLLEYTLEGVKANGGVELKGCHNVAPPGAPAPTALCFAPPMPYWSQSSGQTLLVVADEGFKLHCYNPDAAAVITTHSGPAWGAPLAQLLPFKCTAGQSWLAYSTGYQVVGLTAWPMTGDPSTTMGLITHPGAVAGVALMHDGRRLVTAGEGGVLNLWELNTKVLQPLDAAAGPTAASQTPALPWDDLLGGVDQVAELKDYFTTVQLQQAERVATAAGPAGAAARLMERQQLHGKVHCSALADLLRAGGHYPSQAEVDGALNHVRHLAGLGPMPKNRPTSAEKQSPSARASSSGRVRLRSGSRAGSRSSSPGTRFTAGGSGSPRTPRNQTLSGLSGDSGEAQDHEDESLEFETLLNVLVNHKPLVSVTQEDIAGAFATLGASTAAGVLRREDLIAALQKYGEPLKAGELEQLLQDLTGLTSPEQVLPDYVDAAYFAEEVLGFQPAPPPPAAGQQL